MPEEWEEAPLSPAGRIGLLRRLLNRPAPLNVEPKQDLKNSFLTGVFVSVFLLVFQPFGLSANEPGLKYVLIAGYGFVSFLVIATNLIFLPKWLKKTFIEERWTAAKEILWYLWIVFAVGLAIFLFACLVNSLYPFFRLGFNALLYFLYFIIMTMVVALFPIVFWTLLGQSRRLRSNLRAAEDISGRILTREIRPAGDESLSHPVVLIAENGKDQYAFDAGAILFISALGNYVEVTEKTDKIRAVLIRSSLRRIENQLGECSFLVRCHRAYIVNTKKIRKAAGNAQGLSLMLEDTDKNIPVARAYARPFKERLNRP